MHVEWHMKHMVSKLQVYCRSNVPATMVSRNVVLPQGLCRGSTYCV
jgi:hypothetical protein